MPELRKKNEARAHKAHYPELFEPIMIGNCEIKNRIVMAPMNVLFSMDNQGYANEQMVSYYCARAKGGTGLIITEAVMGTKLASKFPYTTNPHLFNTTHIPGLEEITEAVHDCRAKIFIQMSIGFGRQGHNPDHEPPPAPSPIPYRHDANFLKLIPKGFMERINSSPSFLDSRIPSVLQADMPREMTREEIKSEIKEFGRSCVMAMMANFDGIELHAPHGYLEHQFLSPRSNKRTDEYGGSLENRMRFVIEIYEEVRRMVGDKTPIGIRLSGDEHMPDGIGHDELKQVVRKIGEMGINYVHLSDGSYEALKYFMPDEDNVHLLEEAQSFKSQLPENVPVISVSIHDPALAVQAIKEGKCDMISMGRQMLADPAWASKVREGKKFKKCLRCNDCLVRTAMSLPVRCKLNPELGKERYIAECWPPKRLRGRDIVNIPDLDVDMSTAVMNFLIGQKNRAEASDQANVEK